MHNNYLESYHRKDQLHSHTCFEAHSLSRNPFLLNVLSKTNVRCLISCIWAEYHKSSDSALKSLWKMDSRSANKAEFPSLPGVSLDGPRNPSDNCVTVVFVSLHPRQDGKNKYQHLMSEGTQAATAHLYSIFCLQKQSGMSGLMECVKSALVLLHQQLPLTVDLYASERLGSCLRHSEAERTQQQQGCLCEGAGQE